MLPRLPQLAASFVPSRPRPRTPVCSTTRVSPDLIFRPGTRKAVWRLMAANFAEPLPSGHQGANPMTEKITIEQKWHQQSEDAKNEAEKLPPGNYILRRKSMNGSHRQGYSRPTNAASVDGIPAAADLGQSRIPMMRGEGAGSRWRPDHKEPCVCHCCEQGERETLLQQLPSIEASLVNQHRGIDHA